MIWLFDNHQKYPNLLESNLYYALLNNDRIDKTEFTRGGRPSKARRYVQNKFCEALYNIKPGVEESILVRLEHLSFRIFSSFLSTFKKKVKRRDCEQGEQYQERPDVENEVEVRLGASTYDGICSALSHLYHDSGYNKEEMSPELWAKFSSYKKGSRRVAASEKQKFGLKITEGKKHFLFCAYKLLASIVFKSQKPE